MLIDQFCYSSVEEGEWIEESAVQLEKDPLWYRAWFTFALDDSVACVSYEKETLWCISFADRIDQAERDAIRAVEKDHKEVLATTKKEQSLTAKEFKNQLKDLSKELKEKNKLLDGVKKNEDKPPLEKQEREEVSKTEKKKQETIVHNIVVEPSQDLFVEDSPYSISFLLPNPDGNDTWREEVALRGFTWSASLSWFTLKVWTTRKKILSWIFEWDLFVSTWSYSLRNTYQCVRLLGPLKRVHDEFCYRDAVSWVRIDSSDRSMETASPLLDGRLWVEQKGDDICLLYDKKTLRCRPLTTHSWSCAMEKSNTSWSSSSQREIKYGAMKEKYDWCRVDIKELDTEDKRQRKNIRERIAAKQETYEAYVQKTREFLIEVKADRQQEKEKVASNERFVSYILTDKDVIEKTDASILSSYRWELRAESYDLFSPADATTYRSLWYIDDELVSPLSVLLTFD